MYALSFVGEYQDTKKYSDKNFLVFIKNNKLIVKNYPNLNSTKDYKKYVDIIKGDIKYQNNNFYNHRFGIRGLTQSSKYIYAAGFNFILEISKKNLKLNRILSNRLMNDLHGICYNSGLLYFCLTGKDTLVATNLNGKVVSTFTIEKNLSIIKNDKKILNKDWRFINKLLRGPSGLFHFNYVNFINNKAYLTSRNLSSLVKLNKKDSEIITIHSKERLMLHDGVKYKKKIYFTTVNGKIIVADWGIKNFKNYKNFSNIDQKKYSKNSHKLFNHGLTSYPIDLKKFIKREPTWCRGIYVGKSEILVSIDGLKINHNNPKFRILILDKNLKKKKLFLINKKILSLGNQNLIRILTGFDIVKI